MKKTPVSRAPGSRSRVTGVGLSKVPSPPLTQGESFEQAVPMKAAIAAECDFAQSQRSLGPYRLQALHIAEPEPTG